MLAMYDVNHRIASPYHPQSSGQVELSNPNPTRTSHVTRPFNLYKEGQGTQKRDKKQETISRARHKEPADRRLSHDHNET